MLLSLYAMFFFFQAEDGIRDIGVTGVQTCALPICPGRRPPSPPPAPAPPRSARRARSPSTPAAPPPRRSRPAPPAAPLSGARSPSAPAFPSHLECYHSTPDSSDRRRFLRRRPPERSSDFGSQEVP